MLPNTATETELDGLSNREIEGIYLQISTGPANDFDDEELREILNKLMISGLSPETCGLSSKELLSNDDRLNLAFVTYIKHCRDFGQHGIGMEFVVFCDWFDAKHSQVYPRLHDKLKALIAKGCKSMVGSKRYEKLRNKANPNRTLIERFQK